MSFVRSVCSSACRGRIRENW